MTHEKFTVVLDLLKPDIRDENRSSFAWEKLPFRESWSDWPMADSFGTNQWTQLCYR